MGVSMAMFHRQVVRFCLWAAFASCAWSAEVADYQAAYNKNTQQILQNYQPKFDGLQLQYRKALEAYKAKVQAAGDLKQTLAAATELERFQKDKSMPAEQAQEGSPSPTIRALQSDYLRQYNRHEQEMTAELGTLAQKYAQALDRLQVELTKAGKLEGALLAQAEREKALVAVKGYADQMALLKEAFAPAPAAAAAQQQPRLGAKKNLYLVIDLGRGPKADRYPVSYLSDVPRGGWTDEYKTDKMVLRRLEPGKFVMGSPEDELGRNPLREKQRDVTIKRPFYIGVFEVTQRQWERVTGNFPSYFNNEKHRDARPVESICYDNIRGAREGSLWPATNRVDEASFMGLLRSRINLKADLPTEAQWEYACRAGTSSALNSGKPLTAAEGCPNLQAVGRAKANQDNADRDADTHSGTATVGSYAPNVWGLYDMHGNVCELCLDWYAESVVDQVDPRGPAAGNERIYRGGSWLLNGIYSRSAHRNPLGPSGSTHWIGFRVALPLD